MGPRLTPGGVVPLRAEERSHRLKESEKAVPDERLGNERSVQLRVVDEYSCAWRQQCPEDFHLQQRDLLYGWRIEW